MKAPRAPAFWASHAYNKKNTKIGHPNLNFFLLKTVPNIITLGQPLLGEKYVVEKKEKKKVNLL
jgi:hypothetical protein